VTAPVSGAAVSGDSWSIAPASESPSFLGAALSPQAVDAEAARSAVAIAVALRSDGSFVIAITVIASPQRNARAKPSKSGIVR
jgi:hypothetical protein